MVPRQGSASAVSNLLPDASITHMMVQVSCVKQKPLTYTLQPLLEYNGLEPSLLGKLQKLLVFQAL